MNEVAALREENAMLKADLAWVKGALLSQATHLPARWHFSPAQCRLMGSLLTRDIATYEHLIHVLWFDSVEPEDPRAQIRVNVAIMRSRLVDERIRIDCVRDEGYTLYPPRKAIVLREIYDPVDLLQDILAARGIHRAMRRMS